MEKKKTTIPTQKPSAKLQLFKILLKFLGLFSEKWTLSVAVAMFSKPQKHQPPKREVKMLTNSILSTIYIHRLKQKIKVYQYNAKQKNVLLVHGWSGRGSQMALLAEALNQANLGVISFDAPAHGQSEGNQAHLGLFIECVKEMAKQFGPFEAAVGHSMGGIALLNVMEQNCFAKKIVVIGSGDRLENVFDEFVENAGLDQNIKQKLIEKFEAFLGKKLAAVASSEVAKNIEIPVFVVHDKHDREVGMKAAINIHNNLKNGQILITEGLGHRRILHESAVIEAIINFIKHKK